MRKVIEKCISALSPNTDTKQTLFEALIEAVIEIIVLLVVLILGQLIWNNSIVNLISVAKPAKSVWDILLLAVFLTIIH